MEQNICQSCAMPLTSEDMYSTEKDGSINKDYCKWCYKDGEFIDKCSMEEYIDAKKEINDKFGAVNFLINGAGGKDDDKNGFFDDIHGYDFVNNTGVITDRNGHGTHCAGIAAAVGKTLV